MLGTKSNTWRGKNTKNKTFNNHINYFVNLNKEELSINTCLKSITSQDPTAWIMLHFLKKITVLITGKFLKKKLLAKWLKP